MKKRSEAGDIMLESLLVYSVTIMLLFFILAIFCTLFQRWNIQTIANESATRIAQTYKLSAADTVTGYIDADEIRDVREYRYVWKSNELLDEAEDKLTAYAKNRLKKTTFTKNVREPQIDVALVGDSVARRHIEVTIKGEYSVPFGQVMSYFGFDSTTKYEVTAYAECVDLIDYINTVDFIDSQTSLGWLGSSTVKMINKLLSLFDNIAGLFDGE